MVDRLAEFAYILSGTHGEAANRDILGTVVIRTELIRKRRYLEASAADIGILHKLADIFKRMRKHLFAVFERIDCAVLIPQNTAARLRIQIKVILYLGHILNHTAHSRSFLQNSCKKSIQKRLNLPARSRFEGVDIRNYKTIAVGIGEHNGTRIEHLDIAADVLDAEGLFEAVYRHIEIERAHLLVYRIYPGYLRAIIARGEILFDYLSALGRKIGSVSYYAYLILVHIADADILKRSVQRQSTQKAHAAIIFVLGFEGGKTVRVYIESALFGVEEVY